MSEKRTLHLAEVPPPPHRRLNVFALDPSLAMRSCTRMVSQAVVKVPWGDLEGPGPIGKYLEVVDYDAAAKRFYLPVDLNHSNLLATDGMIPTTSDPRFHQQMVYAVAMKTIGHFEQALGRVVLWAPGNGKDPDSFVERLRIYPHAFRQENAYYDPTRKALVFGYFPARPVAASTTFAGGLVFTCLSFDIVAHETTHAILDGMMRRYIEDTNPDVLAFHEGFADLVALFQHFSLADLLRHEIQSTRGALSAENLLTQLAGQFAEAAGRHGPLRDAIGMSEQGSWTRATPDNRRLADAEEPHARGAVLVSAVFEAFLTIYSTRTADLVRIASEGTGIMRPGAIHPDLVARLADEASKTARHMLSIIIRALDYSPPFDITFGEYLRAIITADYDLVPDDVHGYRVAYVEAFRRWGIYPSDVLSLGEDSLRWLPLKELLSEDEARAAQRLSENLREQYKPFLERYDEIQERSKLFAWARGLRLAFRQGIGAMQEAPVAKKSAMVVKFVAQQARKGEETVRFWSQDRNKEALLNALGIVSDFDGIPLNIEVHEARLSTRVSPDGGARSRRDLIVQVTQRAFLDRETLRPTMPRRGANTDRDMKFRGGCTLVIDTITGEIRYAIRKRIKSESRQARQRDHEAGRFRQESMYPVSGEENARTFELLHGEAL